MDTLLELMQEMGLEPKKVAATGGGEYHSPCPNCGGNDRFFIQPNFKMKNCDGRYACRKCDIKGDTIEFCRSILGMTWEEALKRCHTQIAFDTPIHYKSPQKQQITPPPHHWQKRAESFVDWAHNKIQGKTNILKWLTNRGITASAIERYKIGYTKNPHSKYGCFHLPPKATENSTIWIPEGIVLPTLEPSGAIIRIKIRRTHWHDKDKLPKYVALKGSMQGMNLIGDRIKPVMVIVESELDAYALHDKIHDFALVIAVGSNNKNPDSFTDYLANSKRHLLISHDSDEGGKTMLNKWQKRYPHAQPYPTPIGKDIGEAAQQGINLREWILSGINLNKEPLHA